MPLGNELNVETKLISSLLEYKNPIVIFCFGVLFGATVYFKNINLICLTIVCLLLLLAFFYFKDKKLLILFVSIIFGYFYTTYYFKIFTTELDKFLNQKNVYVGEIISKPDDNGTFYRKYDFRLKKIIDNSSAVVKANTKLQVLGSHYEEYLPGELVQITGVLKKPKGAILPGLFDEKKYLFVRSINYVLKAEPGTLVFLDLPKETLLVRKINKLRESLISLNNKNLPNENLAIVNGITFGSKASNLTGELKNKIQSLGLSHITAASGFNVSILAFGVFCLFRLFSKKNLLPTVVSVFVILIYSSIADFSASIIRASVFIILVLIGNLFDKKLKILPGVGFVVLLFFLFNPVNLLDIGFQLSILAFFGIVLFGTEHSGFIGILNQSFFAQVMTIPLIVFYFHNIQLFGILANIVAVPLASIILILGLLNVLIFPFGYIKSLICVFLKYFSDLFLLWINYLDKIQVKQIFFPNISFYFLILLYIFIIWTLCLFFLRPLRQKLLSLLIFFLPLFALAYVLTDTSKYLKIFCFPKYNQDAVLVLYPDQEPIFFASKLDENTKSQVKDFLKLNSFKSDFNFYNLKDKNKKQVSKIIIKYKNFSFEILKRYSERITNKSNFVRLPMLRRNDPVLSKIFKSFPEYLIVNDYKKLSKKSKKDILWLKSQPTKTLFLSEAGTITLISDGKKYSLDFAGY